MKTIKNKEDLNKDNLKNLKKTVDKSIVDEATESLLNRFKQSLSALHKKNNVYDQIDFWIDRYKIQTPEDAILFQILKCAESVQLKSFITNLIVLEPGVLAALKNGVYIKTNDLLSFVVNLSEIIKYIDNEKEDSIGIRIIKLFLEEKLKFWEKVLEEL